jgi:hypothetical protein
MFLTFGMTKKKNAGKGAAFLTLGMKKKTLKRGQFFTRVFHHLYTYCTSLSVFRVGILFYYFHSRAWEYTFRVLVLKGGREYYRKFSI